MPSSTASLYLFVCLLFLFPLPCSSPNAGGPVEFGRVIIGGIAGVLGVGELAVARACVELELSARTTL